MSANKLVWLGLVLTGAVVGSVPLFFRDDRSFSFKTVATSLDSSLTSGLDGGAIAAPRASAKDGSLGSFNGNPLNRDVLTSDEKLKLYEAESKVYEATEEILSQRFVTNYIEKYKTDNNLSDTKAAQEHLFTKRGSVSDAEVKSFLEEMKDNPGLQKIPERDRVPQVRSYLENRNKGNVMREIVQEGKDKGLILVSLSKPIEPRLEVTDGGNYFLGPKDAKISIVEFTDYQCPFCARVLPALQTILKKYDGKVRWVVRDFPLREIHPEALPAAIAANCAGEQNKYFEMHNKLFEFSSSLTKEKYVEFAKSLNLDMGKFDSCLKDPKQEQEVLADQAEGIKFGVQGTPAFYVNGRKIAGAADVPTLSKMIEEELKLN